MCCSIHMHAVFLHTQACLRINNNAHTLAHTLAHNVPPPRTPKPTPTIYPHPQYTHIHSTPTFTVHPHSQYTHIHSTPTFTVHPHSQYTHTPTHRNNENLGRLSTKIVSPLVMAHVRAAFPGMPVSEQNCHPFQWGSYMYVCNSGDMCMCVTVGI